MKGFFFLLKCGGEEVQSTREWKYLKTVLKNSTCVTVLCITVFAQVLLPLCRIGGFVWLIIKLNPHATDKGQVQQNVRNCHENIQY